MYYLVMAVHQRPEENKPCLTFFWDEEVKTIAALFLLLIPSPTANFS